MANVFSPGNEESKEVDELALLAELDASVLHARSLLHLLSGMNMDDGSDIDIGDPSNTIHKRFACINAVQMQLDAIDAVSSQLYDLADPPTAEVAHG